MRMDTNRMWPHLSKALSPTQAWPSLLITWYISTYRYRDLPESCPSREQEGTYWYNEGPYRNGSRETWSWSRQYNLLSLQRSLQTLRNKTQDISHRRAVTINRVNANRLDARLPIWDPLQCHNRLGRTSVLHSQPLKRSTISQEPHIQPVCLFVFSTQARDFSEAQK